jgi:hypothetical protein
MTVKSLWKQISKDHITESYSVMNADTYTLKWLNITTVPNTEYRYIFTARFCRLVLSS